MYADDFQRWVAGRTDLQLAPDAVARQVPHLLQILNTMTEKATETMTLSPHAFEREPTLAAWVLQVEEAAHALDHCLTFVRNDAGDGQHIAILFAVEVRRIAQLLADSEGAIGRMSSGV